ncbi:damage-inducible protein DinB [Hahella sp. CCB-MM4]|uniref:DinB family protein n=1 Tax=Hahella sp. (strain CCB-MM4) TaxID=1926491 RepID=UPI000B9A2D86|nr:DinB family protein [Hahella sp. CCB-MM4]OZG70337.1 damage-inducible protein DinB [Hahella sp. CCB-MM4]
MNLTTIKALEAFPDQLEQFFNAFPMSTWNWSPDSWEGIPSESLNAIEQICHIRDVEIDGYHIRFRRMLNESQPTLDSLDGYGLVQLKNYAQANPKLVFEEIRSARQQTLQLIQTLTETQLKRVGYFEGYGKLTVAGLVHYLCSHDQQHLSGLQWLLGKIASRG